MAASQTFQLTISYPLLYLCIIACVLIHSCANGARSQQFDPSSWKQHAPLNPIHTDKYGVGVALPLVAGPGGDSYIVTVGFGSPKVDFPLLFDTGSDVSWVHCHSCSHGCNPELPTFNPSLSATSATVSCNHCDYAVGYHDGSTSNGVYANDTISLAPTEVQEGFVFGCAENVTGDFGRTAGVLGLGQGGFSLLAQTDTILFSIFCYCLPPTDSSTGSLWFGVQALESCRPTSGAAKMMSLVIEPNNNGLTNYFVKFTGITIGSQRLNFDSLVSTPMSTIIDSGTVVTRLPPAVYSALREAFRGMMSGYPTAEPTNPMDTCYNLEGQDWKPPAMVLHFEDSVDVGLDPSAVTLGEGDQVCLAFAGNGDEKGLTIIGTQQHRGLKVYYDIHGQKLAMLAGGC